MDVALSVITPVRNGADYIERCVENVAAQECCDRIEHIVMDGLSDDGTVMVARQMQASLPHLKVISERDDGQSDALNKAIQIARGPVIGILNVDDFYSDGVLSRAIEVMSQMQSPALVVGNCNVWDGTRLWYVNKPKYLRAKDLVVGSDTCAHPVNPSAYFYHRILHGIIGWYDPNDDYAMDLDFILRAVRVASFQYIDEVWGNFLWHEGAKTFEDQKGGTAKRRYWGVMNRHLRTLPMSQQMWVYKQRLKVRYWATLRWKARFTRER